MTRRTLVPLVGAAVRAGLTHVDRASRCGRLAGAHLVYVGVAVLLTALLLPTPALAQTTQVVEYYHTDVLGSVRAVTNQQGQVIRRHDFLPFGEELQATNPPPDKPLFTGKERDAETDFDYFGARYQRAGVGRFTSVDPLMTIDKNLVDPQRWNRYAYVRNNPMRWVDPDGRMVADPWDPEGHTDLTRTATLGTKMTKEDQAALTKANLEVDAPSNQLNDPAHYMPGTGTKAEAVISGQLAKAVKAEIAGDHAASMQALGTGLHTVQDRFAHAEQDAGWSAHLPIVGSKPDSPQAHAREYSQAALASRDYVKQYLAMVDRLRK